PPGGLPNVGDMPFSPAHARPSPVPLRIAAVLAAAALTLTGCAGGAGAAATAAAGGPVESSVPPASTPDPIEWEECGEGLDCATAELQLDYSDPADEQFPLAVTRHRATDPDRRVGSLFINPGGPGVPATETVAAVDPDSAASLVSPDVIERFDVVGM